MPKPVASAIHCINPDCPHPYPQTWGNKFCRSCGATLELKNRYIPIQRLGSGGFATIYTVWDMEVQIERVLKVLIEPSQKALELFKQEADVLMSLQHPGVPRVNPDGYFKLFLTNPQERQLPCLVMEKINGQTLQEILDERHPQGCPEAWVVSWLTQAVEILRELHNRQIIHRDIKPSNLMLRQETGHLVVIDFGGAKQFDRALSRQASSTKLFSPGYSPPEQVVGSAITPAVDFYALGKTMIELLTGKYLPELQDPLNGELRWHDVVQVNPNFADLLDEMVQGDVRQRPANAAVIQERLARISNRKIAPDFSKLVQNTWDWLWRSLAAFTKALSQITHFLLEVVTQVVRACLDTIKGMVLGASGACIGTSIGFVLAYLSPLGKGVAALLSQQLSNLLINNQLVVGSEILLFATAGLGTAWGLTAAGGFGQRRRHLVAALMGLLSYSLGWIIWLVATPLNATAGLIGAIAVAIFLLTLGLGLPSHYLVHAVVASTGTITVLASLVSLNIFPVALLPFQSQPSLSEFGICIAFFSIVSLAFSFFLGVSYYLIVPCLRWLGWR